MHALDNFAVLSGCHYPHLLTGLLLPVKYAATSKQQDKAISISLLAATVCLDPVYYTEIKTKKNSGR